MKASNNRPTSVRWRILLLMALASFISYVLRYNVSTAAPAMMSDLALTEIQWGWVLAAFTAGYAVFQLPGGILGDRLGPRRMLTIIAVLWAVFTVATSLVPGQESGSTGIILVSLIAIRFLVGASHAPIYPVLNVSTMRWFPVGGWALPLGLTSTGLTLGVAASAPALAWMISVVGWRLSFIYLAPLGLLAAALWWWYVRDDPAGHRSVNQAEIDLINAGRSPAQESGHKVAAGEWLRVLANRDVLLLTLSYSCMNFVYYIVFSWFFYYLVEIRNFSLTDAGFITSAQWIAGAAGGAIGGWLCDRMCKKFGLRWGCRWPVIIGMVTSGALLFAGAIHPSETMAIAMLVMCFFFNQMNEGPYWATSVAVGGDQAGTAGGVMNTGANLMGVINALLVPWFAAMFGWTFAISSGALFALAGAACMLFVRADRPVDAVLK
jgi:ACS family glucarate transporter-like MFS transporter